MYVDINLLYLRILDFLVKVRRAKIFFDEILFSTSPGLEVNFACCLNFKPCIDRSKMVIVPCLQCSVCYSQSTRLSSHIKLDTLHNITVPLIFQSTPVPLQRKHTWCTASGWLFLSTPLIQLSINKN